MLQLSDFNELLCQPDSAFPCDRQILMRCLLRFSGCEMGINSVAFIKTQEPICAVPSCCDHVGQVTVIS
ncbi:hypothetical protein DOK_17245 [gamma proteobacterium BDW918]|uniref:Uncharacterized protein n=1 Tax=Zhongshania aliphaticivorans TaxID=1470434 RepID=A0A127M9X8_9GAMM|nr:hypothetical protein AZF00_17750 [Zhongshania aliphaticivorans]EIF41791.1 hypothetical protein DOK_17245 [gamma proteobacterium BDW918]